MSDLQEVIARVNFAVMRSDGHSAVVDADDIQHLLDAAEACAKARDAALIMDEGLRAILNAPLPPPIGPAHELRNIARRTLSRLVPVQGSAARRTA